MLVTTDLQRLLTTAGLYSGKIDGIAGQSTMAGVAKALGPDGRMWSPGGQRVGAAQKILNELGYEAGKVDGFWGHNTANAMAAWRHKAMTGKKLSVPRRASKSYAGKASLPTQAQVPSFYGRPGAEIKSRLETRSLPFRMRLDWDLGTQVSRVTLHRLVVGQYVAALEEVRDHYGLDTLRALGIDRYAGGYNHRKMRGGSRWSMHAYGIAVDHYAAPNGLRTRCPEALFCGAEYKPFLDIMERHGWLSLGRMIGRDWMHCQAARIR